GLVGRHLVELGGSAHHRLFYSDHAHPRLKPTGPAGAGTPVGRVRRRGSAPPSFDSWVPNRNSSRSDGSACTPSPGSPGRSFCGRTRRAVTTTNSSVSSRRYLVDRKSAPSTSRSPSPGTLST